MAFECPTDAGGYMQRLNARDFAIRSSPAQAPLPENPLEPPLQNIFQVAFAVQHCNHLQRNRFSGRSTIT
jgi:hypothetical protein